MTNPPHEPSPSGRTPPPAAPHDVDPAVWKPLAAQLTETIGTHLTTSPELASAFRETPRHVLVPHFYRRLDTQPELGWDLGDLIGPDHPDWLSLVYEDMPLITQHKPADVGSDRWITSSSSMPSVMADMIGQLGIRPGMRVVEVGTGTGYNAAILCHLLGDDAVATIDIDPELVVLAKTRLASLGYHPSYTPADNSYDRLLATHGVADIPPQWIGWMKPGGRLLVDLRSPQMPSVGVWAALTLAEDGTASGRTMPSRGEFMNARISITHGHSGTLPAPTEEQQRHRLDHSQERKTDLAWSVPDDAGFWFALWRALPGIRLLTMPSVEQAQADHPDGSWCNVWGNQVVWTGPRDLWAVVEASHTNWTDAGRPSLGDFRIRLNINGDTIVQPATANEEDELMS